MPTWAWPRAIPVQLLERQPPLGGPVQGLSYRPEFPDRFGSLEDARAFSRRCFSWYNGGHRHSGIGDPPDVHDEWTAPVRAGRAQVLADAYLGQAERFVRRLPSRLAAGCGVDQPARPGGGVGVTSSTHQFPERRVSKGLTTTDLRLAQ